MYGEYYQPCVGRQARLQGCACQAPAILALKGAACLSSFRVSIFYVVRLIEHNSPPFYLE